MLRNLKLEPPKPSDEEASRLDSVTVDKQPPQPSSLSLSKAEPAVANDDVDRNSPASLSRLGVRDDGDGESAGGAAAGAGTTAKKVKPPRPKYTWFSLYDEQGVGGRRNSTLRKSGSSGTLSGGGDGVGAADDGDNGKQNGSQKEPGSRTPKEKESSSKSKPEGSWRWGWGRKGSSTPKTEETTTSEGGAGATAEPSIDTAEAAPAAALPPVSAEDTPASIGGRAEQGSDCQVLRGNSGGEGEAPLGLEMLSTLRMVSSGEADEDGATAAAAAAGRRLAESVQRERHRLRRKDVYSYFMMPLVRALEAQMGTTAWLRKV